MYLDYEFITGMVVGVEYFEGLGSKLLVIDLFIVRLIFDIPDKLEE